MKGKVSPALPVPEHINRPNYINQPDVPSFTNEIEKHDTNVKL